MIVLSCWCFPDQPWRCAHSGSAGHPGVPRLVVTKLLQPTLASVMGCNWKGCDLPLSSQYSSQHWEGQRGALRAVSLLCWKGLFLQTPKYSESVPTWVFCYKLAAAGCLHLISPLPLGPWQQEIKENSVNLSFSCCSPWHLPWDAAW